MDNSELLHQNQNSRTYENQIQVVINGEIIKDKIIPRNAGKLNIDVYLK